MAGDYRIPSNGQRQGRSRSASRQRHSTATAKLHPGRPSSSVANHSRFLSDPSKLNTRDPPRSQSTMHYYPEQFYLDKNFDIDKALEYWGLWNSEQKPDGSHHRRNNPSQSSSASCTKRKPRNPRLTRASDLTEFIFNPDCPECCSSVWPGARLPMDKPWGYGLHKSQNSSSTVSTDVQPLTPVSSRSSGSPVLGTQRCPIMYNNHIAGGRFSPCLTKTHDMPDDSPTLSHRLSRPPQDEYFVMPRSSFETSTPCSECPECTECPECSAALLPRGGEWVTPSRPQPRRAPTQDSVYSVRKPRSSEDSLLGRSVTRTTCPGDDEASRFTPTRPAPKPTASRSTSRHPPGNKAAQVATHETTSPTQADSSPELPQERSVWESDSDSEQESRFGVGSLRKVRSKIALRRANRSPSRVSPSAVDAVPPMPTNINHSFSKKNASTGSIQPVTEVLRKRQLAARAPSPMVDSQPEQATKTVGPANSAPQLSNVTCLEPSGQPRGLSKCDTHEVQRSAADAFYSCSQNQTDVDLLLPQQNGLKQAWGVLRSRMKVLAHNKEQPQLNRQSSRSNLRNMTNNFSQMSVLRHMQVPS